MIDALSAALFHFLWQGLLLALIPAVALASSHSPRVRYGAACAALFAMPVAFAVTLVLLAPHGGETVLYAPGVRRLAAAPFADSELWPRSWNMARSLRWFVPLWLAGVVAFYIRTMGSWMVVQRMRRQCSVSAPDGWQQRMDALAARLGIQKAVELLSSDFVDVPAVAGLLRPAIFVPAALFAGMAPEQLEYLLIHELAHIRRFDYAVNLAQKAVEGLLFYHPAVWWVSRVIETERENCCDDAVVELEGNRHEYASVLTMLESRRMSTGLNPALHPAPNPALSAGGGQLSARIFRLMKQPQHLNAAPVFAALAIAFTATFAWAALQQPAVADSSPDKKAQASTAYRKWVNEDVAYIIRADERSAFLGLASDAERERFVEQFWERRNPVPGSATNQFKEEHYRRIAMANTRFSSSSITGWKTDRGRDLHYVRTAG